MRKLSPALSRRGCMLVVVEIQTLRFESWEWEHPLGGLASSCYEQPGQCVVFGVARKNTGRLRSPDPKRFLDLLTKDLAVNAKALLNRGVLLALRWLCLMHLHKGPTSRSPMVEICLEKAVASSVPGRKSWRKGSKCFHGMLSI